ncbi:MAG: 50S ribosomal protein L44e [Nanoarchaeota archaeon]|nr:50S ribosomal protein L44e [Nanoarchaeota archaeon]
MKMPKSVKRYCPSCKKHTLQNVTQNKTGRKRGAMTIGERRHHRRGGIEGYGGFPKPQLEKSSKHKKKTSKKIDIRFECSICKKKNALKNTFRAKKFEIVKIGV